ncbi:MAG: hypothetical protein BGP25_04695 [Lysobacterales bacterium 63-13]|nr:MAG: hypothetical protein BGP25_04695 [Xanthomonadales bacterium 63-13]
MRSKSRDDATQTRRRIAVEAARLIAEHGMRDFHAAKLKAAQRLGLGETAPLPRNAEIEEALREHQRLFQSQSQPAQLRQLREAAIEAMRFFARFEPRLVGAVLEGTADAVSAVCLHLFHDNFGEVIDFLDEHGIPFEQQDREFRFSAGLREAFPALLFSAAETRIDLSVFPLDGLRRAPLDRNSERPMRRATLETVLALLD